MKALILSLATLITISTTAFAQEVEQFEDLDGTEVSEMILPNTGFVCAARGPQGRIYRAFGKKAKPTLRRAVEKCEAVTQNCKPLGCKRRGHIE